MAQVALDENWISRAKTGAGPTPPRRAAGQNLKPTFTPTVQDFGSKLAPKLEFP